MLKRFNFFDKTQAKISWLGVTGAERAEDNAAAESTDAGDEDAISRLPTLSGICGGAQDFLAIADSEGGVSLVNRKLKLSHFFKAHKRRVNLIHQLENMEILVTVGDGPAQGAQDCSTLDLQIKLWHVYVDEAATRATTQRGAIGEDVARASLIHTISLGPSLAKQKTKPYWADDTNMERGFTWPFPTCMDVTEDLQQLAIGFSDGYVILIRTELGAKPGVRSLSSLVPNPNDERPKMATLLDEKAHSFSTLQRFKHIGRDQVTGLGFAAKQDGPQWLWVATDKNLCSFQTGPKYGEEQVSTRRFSRSARLTEVVPGPELDAEGCQPKCCCLAQPSSGSRLKQVGTQFVLAKSDRLQYYSPEDPGSVYALPGVKRLLSAFQNYLVVVTSGPSGQVVGNAPLRSTPGSEESKVTPTRNDVVQLYDLNSKLIAASFPLRGDGVGRVAFVTPHGNKLIIVTSTKKVYVLEEKDMQSKLNDLFQRNQFATAMLLAQSSNCSPSKIQEIHKMYGDHLYAKGSYDDAATQYCSTIGMIEPSYVIRRFLDSQQIHNLCVYLEALHANPSIAPTGDHTTLLLNCYTKQKCEDKLETFIGNANLTQSIDVPAAITVLRDAKYYNQALRLAMDHAQHGEVLSILLEDLEKYMEAITYLRSLPLRSVASHIEQVGRLLMSRFPDETTQVVQTLCCFPDTWEAGAKMQSLDEQEEAVEHLEGGLEVLPDNLFHIFVDHKSHLREFLRCVMDSGNQGIATPLVWNTYLELVLLQAMETQETNPKVKDELEQEAMHILKNPQAKYDTNQALVLVQSTGFNKGQLYLYEKLQMYHMLFRHYMDIGDNAGVLAKCKQYSGKDPNLWVQVLTYFAQSATGKDSEEREIQQVLHHIERLRVLSPLLVVQILSSNNKIGLSTIRPFILSQLSGSKRHIEEHFTTIEHLRTETSRMKQELHSLRTSPKEFTNTKCSLTGAPLELPVVHFLSGNSYNLSALQGGVSAGDMAAAATSKTNGPAPHIKNLEDPKCASEQHAVSDIMTKLQQNAVGVDEEFFNQLEISSDGFSTVAEYFSKCLFEEPVHGKGAEAAPSNLKATDLFASEPESSSLSSKPGPAVPVTRPNSTNPFL